MNELTAEWVQKAEQDFSSADVLLHAGEAPFLIQPVSIASNVLKNISRHIYKSIKSSSNAGMI